MLPPQSLPKKAVHSVNYVYYNMVNNVKVTKSIYYQIYKKAVNYSIKPIKVCLVFLLFFYFQSALTWAEIYIDFFDNGEISYSLYKQKRKDTEISVDANWKKIKETIKGEESCLFKTRFLEDENCYELKNSAPIPQNENIYFRIPRDLSVKFIGNMNCHSLNIEESYPSKLGGIFINTGKVVFIDTDKKIKNKENRAQSIKKYGLHLKHSIHFKNDNKLIFERETLLSLRGGFLTNDGFIEFNKEARLIGKNINKTKNKFLLFSEDDHTRLVNNGHIKGSDDLGLFTTCFISVKGRIQANAIVMDWDNRTGSAFADDIDTLIPLTQESKDYPILDIVRIPDSLRKKYSLDAGDLGEEAACYFYKTFFKKESFSHKSNSQENGLDVIAYKNEKPTQLIIHESKNYHDNSFKLAKNQMTKSWVLGYLFRMHQDFLKENICLLKTQHRRLPESQYDHIKNVLFNVLHEDYSKDLKMLVEWIEEKKISSKNEKYLVKEIGKILRMDAAKMKFKDYDAYFSEDLQVIARGNSIVHCELPVIEECDFNEMFTQPTYFIRRNLDKAFKVRGSAPQPKG